MTVTNRGGTTEKKISVEVIAEVTRIETVTHTLLSLETPAYLDGENEIEWVVISTSSELYRLSYADTSSPLFVAAEEGVSLESDRRRNRGEVIVTVGKREQEACPISLKYSTFCPRPDNSLTNCPV